MTQNPNKTTIFFNKLLSVLAILMLLNFPILPSAALEKKVFNQKTPRKRALLIGISKYKRNILNSWWDLNTELDVSLLNQVLIDKFKFDKKDIVILQDAAATKAGILKELETIVAQTQPGDIVFIHFSGHGDTIPDDNGDKDELDGKDESLIPFDYVSTKDYSKNIRDDEIGKNLDELQKKQPGNVTVSFDSCFSGTATRGGFLVRGGNGNDYEKIENESPSGLNEKNQPLPKDYVFLSATNPRQFAKETSYSEKGVERKMGAYTFALVKALSEATPRTTYRDLSERINDYVKTGNFDQSPQVEGALDDIVLDGTAVKQERFVAVAPMANAVKSDQAILQIGKLQGATIKSRYAIFAAGTKDPNDKDAIKIADGEIVETEGLRSQIKLDKTIDSTQLKTARAFETQHYYADSPLKVILQNVQTVKGGERVVSEFIKPKSRGGNDSEIGFDLAEFTESKTAETTRGANYDIKIYPAGQAEIKEKIVANDFRGLIMERKDGSVLAKISENENLIDEIKTALERENRLNVVKGLSENEDPDLKIKIRVVIAEVETKDCVIRGIARKCVVKSFPKSDVRRNVGGQAELKIGDYIMLEVENTGQLAAYFTILNLTADGKIAPAYPHPEVPKMKENFIKVGQKIMLPYPFVFEIKEPFGEESFRVIATAEPADFSPLIDEKLINQARDAVSRGANPLTEILQDLDRTQRGGENTAFKSPLGRILLTANIGRRSGLAPTVPPSWSMSSFTYIVR